MVCMTAGQKLIAVGILNIAEGVLLIAGKIKNDKFRVSTSVVESAKNW